MVGGPDVTVSDAREPTPDRAGNDIRGEHSQPGAFVIDEVDAVIRRIVDGGPCFTGGGNGIGVGDAVGIKQSGVFHSFAGGPCDGAHTVVEGGGCLRPVEMRGAVEVSGEEDGDVVRVGELGGHVGEDALDFRTTFGLGIVLQVLFRRISGAKIGGIGTGIEVAAIDNHVARGIFANADAGADGDSGVQLLNDGVTADQLRAANAPFADLRGVVVAAVGAVPAEGVGEVPGVRVPGFLQADDVGTGTGDGFNAFAETGSVPCVVAHDGEAGNVFLTREEDRDLEGNLGGKPGGGTGGADGEGVLPGIGGIGSAGESAVPGDGKPGGAAGFLKGVRAVAVLLREVGGEESVVGISGDDVAEADRFGLPSGRDSGDGEGGGAGGRDVTVVREKPCPVFTGRDDIVGGNGDVSRSDVASGAARAVGVLPCQAAGSPGRHDV